MLIGFIEIASSNTMTLVKETNVLRVGISR